MKVINPGYVHPDPHDNRKDVSAHLAALFAGNKVKEFESFDDIRLTLGTRVGGDITDGEIHQAAVDAGYEVE